MEMGLDELKFDSSHSLEATPGLTLTTNLPVSFSLLPDPSLFSLL